MQNLKHNDAPQSKYEHKEQQIDWRSALFLFSRTEKQQPWDLVKICAHYNEEPRLIVLMANLPSFDAKFRRRNLPAAGLPPLREKNPR